MSKQRTTEVPDGNDTGSRKRLVKVFLSDAELKQLRVAAALADSSPGEFARQAALDKAAQVVKRGFPVK